MHGLSTPRAGARIIEVWYPVKNEATSSRPSATPSAPPSGPEALAAALAAQRALHAEPWGSVGPLRVRMALPTGAAEERDGDYCGACLHRANC